MQPGRAQRLLKMNYFRFVNAIIATVLSGTACNSEVFIDDFLPQVPEPITLWTEPAAIIFNAENWDIQFVAEENEYLSYEVTDLQGNRLGLPLENKNLAIVQVQNNLLDFKIERRENRKLNIIPGENMSSVPKNISITVGNKYEQKYISLIFPPTPKYQLDSIAYKWTEARSSDNTLKLMASFKVDNSKCSEPITVFCYPYKKSAIEIQIYPEATWDSLTISNYLGEYIIANVKGLNYFFGRTYQALPAGLDKDMEVKVTIAPKTRKQIKVFNCINEFSVPFVAYASNPLTGRKKEFSGDISCQKPYDYIIIKPEINNGEGN